MVKLQFIPPNDGQARTYCINCQKEMALGVGESATYRCQWCHHQSPRALIIDPKVVWRVDNNGEYRHETAGVFLTNGEGKFLFFERVKYPKGLTIPAGHIEVGEHARDSALRELSEETGARRPRDFTYLNQTLVQGDGCRRGADIHRWCIFMARLPASTTIRLDEREGKRPVWLTPEEALGRQLTFAMRYLIPRYYHAITS